VRRETVGVWCTLLAAGCIAGVLLVSSPALASWLLIIGGTAILAALLAVVGT
jgi:hypothetical protein